MEELEDTNKKSFVGAEESEEELSGVEAGIPEVDIEDHKDHKYYKTMPHARKPAPKKLPPPKMGTPKKAATINELTSSIECMAVSNYSPNGFDTKKPFKIWKFTNVSSYKIAVQLITSPLPERFFKVEVSPDGASFHFLVLSWDGIVKPSMWLWNKEVRKICLGYLLRLSMLLRLVSSSRNIKK